MRVPEVFKRQFKDVELVRMSNGDYCLVRPLGLVPGGKGMKHHENLLRLTPSGIASKLWTLMKLGVMPDVTRLASGLVNKEPDALGLKPSPQRSAQRRATDGVAPSAR